MTQFSLFAESSLTFMQEVRRKFEDVLERLRHLGRCPSIHIEFYPFVGINHTIRLRQGVLFVRLSDLFEQAPLEIIEALAVILLSKLYRRRIPQSALEKYRAFVNSADMKRKSQTNRSQRGRKLQSTPQGSHFNLHALFTQLNQRFFDGRLHGVQLGWSLRKSRRLLGHFDPSHHSITISRIFDDPGVPEAVVSYVLYHEMLHATSADSANFDCRTRHTREFKLREKDFPDFKYANDWIRKNLT
ncbi:MAG: SprT-like domain-containing protein [Terriglobia bacterium]